MNGAQKLHEIRTNEEASNMTLSTTDIDSILSRIINSLKNYIDSSLKKVILYGSYARGDYEDYSDVDIMVLVDSVDLNSMYHYTSQETSDLGLQYLVMISCKFQDITHFYNKISSNSFYRNIEMEGVVYYCDTK